MLNLIFSVYVKGWKETLDSWIGSTRPNEEVEKCNTEYEQLMLQPDLYQLLQGKMETEIQWVILTSLPDDQRVAEMSAQRLQATWAQIYLCRQPSNVTRRDGRQAGGATQKALYQFRNLVTAVQKYFVLFYVYSHRHFSFASLANLDKVCTYLG